MNEVPAGLQGNTGPEHPEGRDVQPPGYIVTANLYTPKGRLVGRLERTWQDGRTIADLCSLLISNSQDRADIDRCRIELRWRRVPRTETEQDEE